ncbi:MAG: beta tubulin [Rhodospirillales bacterium 20-64-7]|nr:MAG: beta tubulin [Rhodospirillales bacterium 20-64-7]
MLSLQDDLAAHLAGGVTTFCHCWRLIRRDGTVLGFTDHDCDLVFDGVTHAGEAGLDATQVEASLGFAVGGGEVNGALMSDLLTEIDLSAGRFDGASVETWLVNHADVSQRILLDTHLIGQVARSDVAFTAELRSLASLLDQDHGRVFQLACTADLGDAQCGVKLDVAGLSMTATVVETDARVTITANLGSQIAGAFSGGKLQFTSGANAGITAAVKEHAITVAGHVLTLWSLPASAILPNDSFIVSAGCDKSFATCRDRFGNVVNFRGCPHMPGNDIVMAYPSQTMVMDGGSLFQ